ncbi:hypothetical protein O181_006541 [Austropuccinia psidii MF-1]|uniref:Uncharacterized protein n=1 Tax=Austropuccinia psidii MF-1 TaxID=1389203 RepID=A0A9Q3GGV1_9BASI|nr:hypothetical protein [Austropuccinia psidii MF-1]
MTDQHDPSSSQQPNLVLMLFELYSKILFIIGGFIKQYFKVKVPKEYDCNSHSQCKCFTPISPASNSTLPLNPVVFSMSPKKKLIQLPSGSDLPMMFLPHCIIENTLLPHEKTGIAFLWHQQIPKGKSACNVWATSSPGSTFNARHIIINKVVSLVDCLRMIWD